MTGTGADERPRVDPRASARASRRSFTGRALILGLVMAGLLVSVAVPVRAWFAQRAEIASLRADVEAARARVADLQVQTERWKDPSFVAAEARRRLHFVLPGEVGYVALGVDQAAAAASAAAEGDQGPWYSQLWGALQRADEPGDAGAAAR